MPRLLLSVTLIAAAQTHTEARRRRHQSFNPPSPAAHYAAILRRTQKAGPRPDVLKLEHKIFRTVRKITGDGRL